LLDLGTDALQQLPYAMVQELGPAAMGFGCHRLDGGRGELGRLAEAARALRRFAHALEQHRGVRLLLMKAARGLLHLDAHIGSAPLQRFELLP
jgi:hypothetical protein